MKITVLGAGAIGSAMACDLVQRDDVTMVQVCDARARSLQDLHDRMQSRKLRSFQVDARDPSVLEPILSGSDCVIGSLPPKLNPGLAALSVEIGAHYCDLGGNQEIVEQQLALDARAREKSVWVIPNCGLAPGLVNILCLRGVEQFDRVEAAYLRVGDVPLHPEPPFNFRISWSAEKVIEDYTSPVLRISHGEVARIEPLTHVERIRFPEPFGEMEAFATGSSVATLIRQLEGQVRHLDFKTIRWPGHAHQMQFLLGLGFGEERSIDVRTHLTYRDVLVRSLRKRLGGPHQDAVLLRVVVQGEQDGRERTLVYEMVDRFHDELGMTAMERSASIPTTTVACLVAQRGVDGGGAAPPEQVVPKDAYCRSLAERGLDIQTTWHDGYVDAADPGVPVAGEATD